MEKQNQLFTQLKQNGQAATARVRQLRKVRDTTKASSGRYDYHTDYRLTWRMDGESADRVSHLPEKVFQDMKVAYKPGDDFPILRDPGNPDQAFPRAVVDYRVEQIKNEASRDQQRDFTRNLYLIAGALLLSGFGLAAWGHYRK